MQDGTIVEGGAMSRLSYCPELAEGFVKGCGEVKTGSAILRSGGFPVVLVYFQDWDAIAPCRTGQVNWP